MLNKISLKRYSRQTLALIEKDFYLEFRIRASFFNRFITPIIELFLYLIIFGMLFNVKEGFALGYWNADNFVLFLLIAYSIHFSIPIITKYQKIFMQEKYWKTLSAILTAPVNRFTLLIGTLISELLIISIPLFILLIIAFILFPISFINLMVIIIIFIAIFLIFGSMGLIIGAFAISNEEYVTYLNLILRFIFLLSCTNLPKEIFPEVIQNIVVMNPFYYLFDLLRLTWYMGIDSKQTIAHITPLHIIFPILLTAILPGISLIMFNKVYKKYGITGY